MFCAAQGDCEIKIERVADVYHDKVGEFFADIPVTFSTLGAFMSYFVDQNVGSDSVVYVLHYLIWAGGALANIFLGDIGTKALQTILLLAANDPSSDWEILCEDCPAGTWEHTMNLRDGQLGWEFPTTSTGVWGDYVPTEGMAATYGLDSPPSCVKMFVADISVAVTGSSTLTEVEFVYSADLIPPLEGVGLDYLKLNTTNLWTLTPSTLTEGTDQTRLITGLDANLVTDDVLQMSLRCLRRFTTVTDAGYVVLHSITFRGTGEEPVFS